MINIQTYVYKNLNGREKTLTVNWNRKKENKYFCLIGDLETGELCGTVYRTKEEIINFLAQYGVKI